MAPINVLCLHGCCQTQEIFEKLMKTYIRLGEKQYNLKFHFTEAKYDHPDGGKTWYNRPLVVGDIGTITYSEDLVKDTLEDIYQLIETNNIDVLLGFSQGGNVVDTFMAYKEHKNIKGVVIMSGYSLINEKEDIEYDTPTLAVTSKADTVVPFDLTKKLYPNYILEHDKGHKVPTRNPQIRKICKFMQTLTYIE